MKLTNFGIFRVVKPGQPLFKVTGTKGWSAPEIYSQSNFTFAMDIFSLGILFAYVLSRGVHPFGSEKEDRIFNIKRKQPMSFTIQHLKDVVEAADIFDLICSMLSFDPEERPTSSAVLNNPFFNRVFTLPSSVPIVHETTDDAPSSTITPTQTTEISGNTIYHSLFILQFCATTNEFVIYSFLSSKSKCYD